MILLRWMGLAAVAASLGLMGCSGFSSGSGGGGSTAVSGIFGKVTGTNASVYSVKPKGQFEVNVVNDIDQQAVPDCTVSASELGGADTVVATATSDISGDYTLTGLDATKTYRVTTDCLSGEKYSSVGKTSLDSSTRILTNPRSTLIAAMVVKSVLSAIDSATTGLAGAVKDQVANSLKKSMDSIVSRIQATVQDQIEAGAIPDPSPATANTLTTSIATADALGSAAVGTNVNTSVGATIPPSVTNDLNSAAAATAALPKCDGTLASNQPTSNGAVVAGCVVAIAKIMRNVLGFPVGLLNATITSVVGGICASSNAALVTLFPNSDFKTHADDTNIPAGFCAVIPNMPRIDRNRVFDYSGGGDNGNHGPVFIEATGGQVGVLTEMAKAMLNANAYLLSDIDKMIYSRSGAGATLAGMDGRLVAEAYVSGAANYYYIDSTGNFVHTSWPTCTANAVTKDCVPSRHGDNNFAINMSLASADWTDTPTGANGAALSTIFSNAAYRTAMLTFSPTLKSFGGTIPSASELKIFLDSQKIHSDYNPYGPAEFYVMYNKSPYRSQPGGTQDNGCWDNDTSTPCYGQDHDTTTPYPAVLVTFTKQTNSGDATGYKNITSIAETTTAGTSTYYALPIFKYSNGPGIWAQAFKFIKSADGKPFRDEVGRDRAIYVVTNQGTQCNAAVDGAGASLPAAGAGATGCQNGYVYNAYLDYSTCPTTCPSVHLADVTGTATPILASGVPMVITPRSEIRSTFTMYPGKMGGHQVLAVEGNQGRQPVIVRMNTDGTLNTGISARLGFLDGTANTLDFYLGMTWSCSGSGSSQFCTPDTSGFFLADSNGLVVRAGAHTIATPTNVWAPGTVLCSAGVSNPSCVAQSDYVKVLTTDLAAAVFDFDPVTGGTQGFNATFKYFVLDMGPVPNPVWHCSGEPFFVAPVSATGSAAYTLSCSADDTAVTAGYKTFGNKWDYYNWLNEPTTETPARSTRALVENSNNAFAYGDPDAAKALISTAFNGWLDGSHSLTETTRLNALQAFGLIYMTLSQDSDRRFFKSTSTITGATGAYYLLMPMNYISGNGGNDAGMINTMMGNGISTFKQP
jgi:hypothetical protein